MEYIKYLKAGIVKKKKKYPAYSNNAMARDLGISPAFFSKIVNGQKKIPSDLILKLCDKLEFDDFSRGQFLKAIIIDSFKETIFEKYLADVSVDKMENFLPLLNEDSCLLDKWYYIALLEFITCNNFKEDIDYIAKKLNISKDNVAEALFVLKKENLISESGSGLVKNEKYLRADTSHSYKKVRNFHSQMIEKAKSELQDKTSDEDFKKRLITGITISADPDKIARCKDIIEEAIHKIGIEASSGDCSNVYQINLQFFSLLDS